MNNWFSVRNVFKILFVLEIRIEFRAFLKYLKLQNSWGKSQDAKARYKEFDSKQNNQIYVLRNMIYKLIRNSFMANSFPLCWLRLQRQLPIICYYYISHICMCCHLLKLFELSIGLAIQIKQEQGKRKKRKKYKR